MSEKILVKRLLLLYVSIIFLIGPINIIFVPINQNSITHITHINTENIMVTELVNIKNGYICYGCIMRQMKVHRQNRENLINFAVLSQEYEKIENRSFLLTSFFYSFFLFFLYFEQKTIYKQHQRWSIYLCIEKKLCLKWIFFLYFSNL